MTMTMGMLASKAASSSLSLSYINYYTNAVDASTYTFSGASIGTANANRYVVVGFQTYAASGASSVSSITIGGTGATQIGVFNSAGPLLRAGLYYANIASGTTADIVLNFSSTQGHCGIGVWTVTGNLAGIEGLVNTTTDVTFSSVSAGDVLVAMARRTASSAITWTNVTENFQLITESGISGMSGASITASSAASNYVVTCSTATPQFVVGRFYR